MVRKIREFEVRSETGTITRANSDDWRSWQGAGRARLRDGFLWDIPIFGFFSPMLRRLWKSSVIWWSSVSSIVLTACGLPKPANCRPMSLRPRLVSGSGIAV